LSSTEADYFALSEEAMKLIFVKQVIDSIGYKISFPIVNTVDNVGAIYLANNHTTSQHTKQQKMSSTQHYKATRRSNSTLKPAMKVATF
jgi:hypothetical protein